MKILVVGGSGLLGYHVLAELRLRGHETTTVARTRREGVDRVVDVATAAEDELRELLAGHDGVVFAGGTDDRRIDKGPVGPRLHAGNVAPVVALLKTARAAGCTRAAVLASYYTYFDRVHPEWGLAAKHPYVRSRLEQARVARETAGPDLPVAFIEVPYVFGVAPGRVPEWSRPVVKWVRSSAPLFAPPGGSAATSARGVGIATVDALEDASGADIPVVEENLRWADMLSRMAGAAGKPRAVRTLPAGVVRAAFRVGGRVNGLTGKEPGLTIEHLGGLFLRELFVDPLAPRSVDEAIRETAKA
ncbi:NAD(P)-dependent oxidoreductase [Amycolatopsis sp. FDAARGOS 1241]|uniref:NAD-dependent epimerase/dehydratase family protein n=1 Tax=Amycolatopsis sp. FDAARGOS 1241 TaxID=2778070 RepID=UPI0019503F68|nr:NAD(P)H-binding protein [Amycolatopsis sp. FDAARGOS 1241]QRP46985.1 NAD(P)H-binding protein [Amycolatopsis sp. FDAARGOS 1241]